MKAHKYKVKAVNQPILDPSHEENILLYSTVVSSPLNRQRFQNTAPIS